MLDALKLMGGNTEFPAQDYVLLTISSISLVKKFIVVSSLFSFKTSNCIAFYVPVTNAMPQIILNGALFEHRVSTVVVEPESVHFCQRFPLNPTTSIENSMSLTRYLRVRAHSSDISNCVASHCIKSHQITSHQVTSNHIKSHQITSNHIKSHQITSNHIGSHQITLNHIKSH